ncbi:MAG: amidohydrolase family protein [Phycisphaerales bacterium]|nr:amidohydrolase family protein [Phycisphaerales bacterium]
MNGGPTNLREAHAHIFQLGRSLTMSDLSGCTSREEAIQALAEHARGLAPGGWVLAHGIRTDAWEDPRYPTTNELDHACAGRPVCAWCFDYHALCASSAALAHAGIDKDTRIRNGRVCLDDAGNPTGVLLEHAALLLWNSVPEPGESQRHALVRDACVHLAELGFVEVHDLKAQPWLGGVLSDLITAGEINMRAKLFPLEAELELTIAARPGWHGAVTLGGVKIFTDGTLNSRTAWMLEPFADAPPAHPSGTPMMTNEEIAHACWVARSHGLPIAAHAIGDGAVRAVLNAIESTDCAHNGCRIEHAELVHPDDLGRFAELGVIASVQPCHLLPDIEALRKAVPDRLDRVLPIRALIDSGLEPGTGVLFGSDVPIVRAAPGDSIQTAVHRRRAGMSADQAIGIEQAITEDEAWACFGG